MMRLRAWLFWAVNAAAIAGFLALGDWQVHRLAWKQDLIARVTARVSAPPVMAPLPNEWGAVSVRTAEYRHVALAGVYDGGHQVLVQALTGLGAGWWVMTPLAAEAGFTVLVNRGFVPDRAAPKPPSGTVHVDGLLRITEPGGAFLRRNQPGTGRWYSRDVQAIAKAQALGSVAPYFIDAGADPQAGPEALPVGGLTVVAFPNHHLIYAATWFSLAVLVAGMAGWANRPGRRDTD